MLIVRSHGEAISGQHAGCLRGAGARGTAQHPRHPGAPRGRAAVGVPGGALPAQLADDDAPSGRPREGRAHRGAPRGPQRLLPPEPAACAPGGRSLAAPSRSRRARADVGAVRPAFHRGPAPAKPTKRSRPMTNRTKTDTLDTPKIFRITLEVANLDEAAAFYARLLGREGKRHPGSRHYFDCGGVILALLDPTPGGVTPTPGPKSLYFAVEDLDAAHARAKALKALAPYKVHGQA